MSGFGSSRMKRLKARLQALVIAILCVQALTSSAASSQERRDLMQSAVNPELEPATTYIIGGTEAELGEFPFMAQGSLGCGASLVWKDIVLTAAHCQDGYFDRGVLVGAYRSEKSYFGAEWVGMADKIVNPDANASPPIDLMLIKLDRIVNSPYIRTIQLSPDYPKDGDTLTVIGFGTTAEKGAGSYELRKVDVNFVDTETCRNVYGNTISSVTQVCAGVEGGGKDACYGDSGGPLLDEAGRQVGVVSFGSGCARPGVPGVYASVAGAYQWIQSTICNVSAEPPALCLGSPTSPPVPWYYPSTTNWTLSDAPITTPAPKAQSQSYAPTTWSPTTSPVTSDPTSAPSTWNPATSPPQSVPTTSTTELSPNATDNGKTAGMENSTNSQLSNTTSTKPNNNNATGMGNDGSSGKNTTDPNIEQSNSTGNNDFHTNETHSGYVSPQNASHDGAGSGSPEAGNTTTEAEMHTILIEVVHDNSPADTSFILTDQDGEIFADQAPGSITSPGLIVNISVVAKPNVYFFDILDRGGDGICCSDGHGEYNIYIDGRRIVHGDGNFGSQASVRFVITDHGDAPSATLEEVEVTSGSRRASESIFYPLLMSTLGYFNFC